MLLSIVVQIIYPCIDSAEYCATKIINMAMKVRNKFRNAKVGVSGLTYREDVSVNAIRVEVNEKLKNLSVIHEFCYI
jgi:cobalamin biosynthesis Co2+ chelatase CbiK